MKNTLLFMTFIALTFHCQAQTVTDVDGNLYHTVTIGTQTWMAENLRTTKYNDSTAIPNVPDGTLWGNLTTPGVSTFNNTSNTDTINTYGRLYNWYAVNTGKLAPKNWHVPTDDEWTTLENFLIANGYNYNGTTTGNNYAKTLASGTGWNSSSYIGAVGNSDYPTKRNASGFTALPGGFRNNSGSFVMIGYYGFWWCSTEAMGNMWGAWNRSLFYNDPNVSRSYLNKSGGFSVRCVMDISTNVVDVNKIDQISVYPNPALDKLFIKNENNASVLLIIYDTQGNQILSKYDNTNIVDISGLKSGYYIVKLISSGEVQVRKIIKE